MTKIYRFAIANGFGINKYQFNTYKDAEFFVIQQIEKFKMNNCVKDENTDKSFIRFKSQLLSILNE